MNPTQPLPQPTVTEPLPATPPPTPLRPVNATRWAVRALTLIGVFVVGTLLAFAGTQLRAHARAGIAPQLQEVESWDDLARYVSTPEGVYGMVGHAGDQTVAFPALDVDITVDIQGDIATVTVVQTFENPSDVPLNATYLFPLPTDAAVHAMTMQVGNERIRAQIERREEATAIFEEAQANGQAAALTTQERPNVFTQRVANLMPGLPVRVELRYLQQVPRADGLYDLAVPLVVGPRFNPAAEQSIADPATGPIDNAPTVAPGATAEVASDARERVSITVHLDGGVPIRSARSTTHPMRQDWHGASAMTLTLADARVPDDRDFRFMYALGDDDITAAMHTHRDENGGYFSLRIDPPTHPADDQISPREMVFLLDTSGSMFGLPLDASKAFTTRAIRNLRPTDTFRIVRFGDDASEFSAAPLPATPGNIERGIEYVETLTGAGGTQMLAGLEQALGAPLADGVLRMVVFLTDGYIGNDQAVLAAIEECRGDARLFAFGVGAATNRYLLEELGKRGRGFTRFLALDEDVDAAVRNLVDDLQSPVLTDVEIHWGGLAVSQVYPTRIPDVFAGRPIRVVGRFDEARDERITIHGNVGGEPTYFTVPVTFPTLQEAVPMAAQTRGVALLWAREAIDEGMAEFTALNRGGAEADALREHVTQLGLAHDLVTQWTAFVAVSETVVNTGNAAHDTDVAVSSVHGTMQSGGGFVGTSAPEPFTWLALLTAGATAAAGRGAKRRALAGDDE